MGFKGDANEPGGILASKVTATISVYGHVLKKGEDVELMGGSEVHKIPDGIEVAEAKKRAKSAGFTLAKSGGKWKLKKN